MTDSRFLTSPVLCRQGDDSIGSSSTSSCGRVKNRIPMRTLSAWSRGGVSTRWIVALTKTPVRSPRASPTLTTRVCGIYCSSQFFGSMIWERRCLKHTFTHFHSLVLVGICSADIGCANRIEKVLQSAWPGRNKLRAFSLSACARGR